MIVLDTNIISEITKTLPNRNVSEWFAGSPEGDIYLCDTVLMEQSYGAERFWLKAGSRRYYETFERLLVAYNGRILPFDRGASIETGRLRAQRESIGRPISLQDAMIAATCLAHGATLATRNVKDFEGLDLRLLNPFEGA